MWRLAVSSFAFLSFGTLVPAPSCAQSLEQAVAMAVDTSARFNRADAGVALANEERVGTAAQGRLRVQVDGSSVRRGEYGEQRNVTGRVSGNDLYLQRHTLGVTMSQSIYTGGRLREALEAADSRIVSAEFRANAAEITAARNAAAAYAEMLRAQKVATIVSGSVTELSEDVRGAEARFAAGEVSITDVAQSKARYAGALSQAARANGELENARATFERFVGQKPSNLVDNLPTVAIPVSLQVYLDTVSTSNLDLMAARADFEGANGATRLAATQRNPRVSLEASYERRWNETFAGSKSYVGQIGARVTIPLWDGGQTSSNVRQAAARASSSRYQMQDTYEEIRASAQRAWSDYQTSKAVLRSALAQVEAAQLARTGAQEELRFGLRSTIEALNQEQELRAARLALVTAQRDLYVDLIDLLALMGLNPLGQPARSMDPARSSAVQRPANAKPLALEAPLVTVLEFLEANDRPVSDAFYQINRALEPTKDIGPIP